MATKNQHPYHQIKTLTKKLISLILLVAQIINNTRRQSHNGGSRVPGTSSDHPISVQFSSKRTDRSAASPYASPVVTELRQAGERGGSVSRALPWTRLPCAILLRARELLPYPLPLRWWLPSHAYETFFFINYQPSRHIYTLNSRAPRRAITWATATRGWTAARGRPGVTQGEEKNPSSTSYKKHRTSGANSAMQVTKFVEASGRQLSGVAGDAIFRQTSRGSLAGGPPCPLPASCLPPQVLLDSRMKLLSRAVQALHNALGPRCGACRCHRRHDHQHYDPGRQETSRVGEKRGRRRPPQQPRRPRTTRGDFKV